MKLILTVLTLLFTTFVFSQSIYYDDSFHVVTESKAVVKATGVMSDSLYEVKGNYIKSHGAIACFFHYKDSTLKVKEGLWQEYYKKGKLATTGYYHNNHENGLWIHYLFEGNVSDSIIFKNGEVTVMEGFYYYDNKQVMVVSIDDVENNKFLFADYSRNGVMFFSSGFDMDYSRMSFTPDKQAEYPGGPGAWRGYITRAIEAKTDELTDKDYGTALIQFVVDTSGKVSHVQALCMLGSVLAGIGIEAINKGPDWIPASKDGRKVEAIRIQPITITDPGK